MEAARIPKPPVLTDLIRILLIGALLGLALAGWVVTDERMHGMDAGPGTDLGTLGFYVTAWVVMMAAMMFPSIWPMVLMYRRVQLSKRERGQTVQAGATAIFVGAAMGMDEEESAAGMDAMEPEQGSGVAPAPAMP